MDGKTRAVEGSGRQDPVSYIAYLTTYMAVSFSLALQLCNPLRLDRTFPWRMTTG